MFEDTARNGVDLLRILIETAQHAQAHARPRELSDALAEALDVLAGNCAPHLAVRTAEPRVSWFTVHDADGSAVVERMPERRTPNIVMCWARDEGDAELLAKLLTDNEAHDRPRVAITRGERLPEAS